MGDGDRAKVVGGGEGGRRVGYGSQRRMWEVAEGMERKGVTHSLMEMGGGGMGGGWIQGGGWVDTGWIHDGGA